MGEEEEGQLSKSSIRPLTLAAKKPHTSEDVELAREWLSRPGHSPLSVHLHLCCAYTGEIRIPNLAC
ncbi:hypothetical protein CVT25_000195 [Psilocybe cyanescens]|uniref:Uncharacterized protein n=1 Tax=Psilocybe cyanescens TaxID=93625 RepID=A0A409XQK3_PSICY|nr:hypothetical protein CVT25_000195 [Psilocybe cyanescens]